MKKNMGGFDRGIMILIAIILGYLYYIGYIYGFFGIALVILAMIFAVTSFINFCPLYSFLGINTNKKKS